MEEDSKQFVDATIIGIYNESEYNLCYIDVMLNFIMINISYNDKDVYIRIRDLYSLCIDDEYIHTKMNIITTICDLLISNEPRTVYEYDAYHAAKEIIKYINEIIHIY